MKTPNECSDMNDIRTEIDRIDQEIIELMGKRFKYVICAAKFKTSEDAVRAPERFNALLRQQHVWVEKNGLNPEVIEKLYSDLVTYFMEEEMNEWKQIKMAVR